MIGSHTELCTSQISEEEENTCEGEALVSELGWPEDLKNKSPMFSKSSPSSLQTEKIQNIYNTAQFESPNTFKSNYIWNLKIPTKNHVWKLLLGEHVINLLYQKVAQNVPISLGYFFFTKNHNEPRMKQKCFTTLTSGGCTIKTFFTARLYLILQRVVS